MRCGQRRHTQGTYWRDPARSPNASSQTARQGDRDVIECKRTGCRGRPILRSDLNRMMTVTGGRLHRTYLHTTVMRALPGRVHVAARDWHHSEQMTVISSQWWKGTVRNRGHIVDCEQVVVAIEERDTLSSRTDFANGQRCYEQQMDFGTKQGRRRGRQTIVVLFVGCMECTRTWSPSACIGHSLEFHQST